VVRSIMNDFEHDASDMTVLSRYSAMGVVHQRHQQAGAGPGPDGGDVKASSRAHAVVVPAVHATVHAEGKQEETTQVPRFNRGRAAAHAHHQPAAGASVFAQCTGLGGGASVRGVTWCWGREALLRACLSTFALATTDDYRSACLAAPWTHLFLSAACW
jgi:hypothetical protein